MTDTAHIFILVVFCALLTLSLHIALAVFLRFHRPHVYEKVGRPSIWISPSLAFRSAVWREFPSLPLPWKAVVIANFVSEGAMLLMTAYGVYRVLLDAA